MTRRSFAPTFYSGRSATADFLDAFTGSKPWQDAYPILKASLASIEGAADAPWCALILCSALGKDGVRRLCDANPSMAQRIQTLFMRCTGANKPQWVSDLLANVHKEADS